MSGAQKHLSMNKGGYALFYIMPKLTKFCLINFS